MIPTAFYLYLIKHLPAEKNLRSRWLAGDEDYKSKMLISVNFLTPELIHSSKCLGIGCLVGAPFTVLCITLITSGQLIVVH